MERGVGRALRRARAADRRAASGNDNDPRPVVRRARRAAPLARAHLLSRGTAGISRQAIPRRGLEEPEYSAGEIRRGEPESRASGSRLACGTDCRGYRAVCTWTGESSLTRSTEPCGTSTSLPSVAARSEEHTSELQ